MAHKGTINPDIISSNLRRAIYYLQQHIRSIKEPHLDLYKVLDLMTEQVTEDELNEKEDE